ncbi:cupredoxin domain-containing protein [Varunaivibrio sulfuroxidans]|uniref:Putative cupredoxin-like copper-binding protein n=1 Tax=Varunaivibrio sulfuroxidans TaxID=1773489 RepID=A0A4R3J5A1_9PROT|nr:plastocyanin/azurin family copper-binding protein [Varunaivibrio sulfuroxidans]TCS60998.1 putative cupredoxin-like copper-binding protein [Varunaivibrio sulfuroxidans]WES31596.1 plastocyanin/azurin family copper-binding protein [Varunaivibrio sulfuroxidans]
MAAKTAITIKTFTLLFVFTTVLSGALGRTPMVHAADIPPGRPGAPTHVDRTITLAIKDKGFGPKTIKVRAHETVRFVVKNHDNIHHAFVLGAKKNPATTPSAMLATLDGEDVELTPTAPWSVDIPAGASRGLIWTFASAGAVTFYCTQPGHEAEGMHGTISVIK